MGIWLRIVDTKPKTRLSTLELSLTISWLLVVSILSMYSVSVMRSGKVCALLFLDVSKKVIQS